MYKARIYVTLKPAVRDPQGESVAHALGVMGYKNVGGVRMGKFMEIDLADIAGEGGAAGLAAARAQIDEMCRRLLANPVIEQYSFEVQEVQGGVAGAAVGAAAGAGRQAP